MDRYDAGVNDLVEKLINSNYSQDGDITITIEDLDKIAEEVKMLKHCVFYRIMRKPLKKQQFEERVNYGYE